MRLLLLLKPWLLMLLLYWELDISDTSDPNSDGISNTNNPSNLKSHSNIDSSQNQQESSSLQLDISKFTVLTNDEKSSSNLVVVDKTKYLLEDDNNFYRFKFKDNVKCSVLKYEDQIVWEHDFGEYGYHYPKEITISSDELTVEIKNYILTYKYRNDKWVLISKSAFESYSYNHFTITAVDEKSITGFSINDTSQFDTFSYNSGLIFFLFKDDARCTEVKYDNKIVWEYDKDIYNNNYPRSIIYKPECHIYVDFDNGYQTYQFDSDTRRWVLRDDLSRKSSSLVELSKHPKYLKVFTLEDPHGTNLKENDTDKYRLYSYFEGFYLVVFNPGVICHEFKFKDTSLWQYDKEHNPNRFPKSISVDLYESVIEFEFGDETLRFRLSDSGFISYIVKSELTSYVTELKTHTKPGTYSSTQESIDVITDYSIDAQPPEDSIPFTSSQNSKHVLVQQDVIPSNVSTIFKSEETIETVEDANVTKLTVTPSEGKDSETQDGNIKTKTAIEDKTKTEGSILTIPTFEGESSEDTVVPLTVKVTSRPVCTRTPVDLDIGKDGSNDYLEYVRDDVEDLKIYNAKENFIFSTVVINGCCFSDSCESVYDHCLLSWLPDWCKSECCKQHIIWDSEYKSEYVYKVILKGSKDYPRYLLLLPIEGDLILLYKESKDIDWRDITSLRISFSDFSFFGTDKTSSGIKQIYQELYERSTHKFMFGYRFKEGVRCSEVMYKGVTLWTDFDISKDNYPYGVYYDLVSKKLNILLSDNKFMSLEIPTSVITTASFSKFKIITEGSDYPNDRSMYNLKVTPDTITYKFNLNSKCTEIKYENKTIWKFDQEKHEYYPIYVFVHIDIKKVYIIIFNSMFVCSLEHYSWSGTETHLSQLDIKNEKRDEEYEYSDNKKSKIATFKARENYGFNKIVIETKRKWYSLWLYKSTQVIWESDNKDEYAIKVSRDGISTCRKLEHVDVDLVNGDILKYVKGGCASNQWIHVDTKKVSQSSFSSNSRNSTTINTIKELIELDINSKKSTYQYNYSNKVCIFTAKDNVVINEVTKTKGSLSCDSDIILYHAKFYYECAYKVVVEDIGSNNEKLTLYLVNGRVLTLTKENDYNFISKLWVPFDPLGVKIITEGSDNPNDYTKYDIFNDRDTFYYIFKPGAKCTEVSFSNTSIWKLDPKVIYPRLVSYDKSESRFLFSFDGENIVYKKENVQWNKAIFKLGVLDINTKRSTVEYEYSKRDKTTLAIFKSKQGYGFRKIIEKRGEWNRFSKDKIIWESDETNEHAVKVIIDGIGLLETTENLHLYLSNGELLKYTKSGGVCSKQWTLVESKQISAAKISPLKSDFVVFTYKDSDPSNPDVNNTSKFKVDGSNPDLSEYIFKEGVKCVGFKMDTDVWNYDQNKPNYFPKELYVHNVKKMIFAFFSDASYLFYYNSARSNEWVSVPLKTMNSVQATEIKIITKDPLDNTKTKENDSTQYYLKTYGFGFQYIFRPGTECIELKHGDVSVWQFDSNKYGKKYPTVIYYLSNKKVVLLFGEKARLVNFDINKSISTEQIQSHLRTEVIHPISSKKQHKTINSSFSKFKIITEGSDYPNDRSMYNLKVTPDTITYKFNLNSKCTEIKYENKTIWKYDHSKFKGNFPSYIFFHNDIKIAYVKIKESIFVCTPDDQKMNGSQGNPTQLDIKIKESNNDYVYFKDVETKVVTFTAKDNVLFQEVIRKKSGLSCGSDQTLYQTKELSQNAYKVVVEGLDSKSERLTLYLVNGRVLSLTKENDYNFISKLWVPFDPLGVKIITEGSDNPNDYTKYDIFNDRDTFYYIFKPGAKCIEVFLRDESLWKHERDDTYLKSLLYDRQKHRVLFSFDGKNVVYRKFDNKWNKRTFKLYGLDINYRESTIQYNYNKNQTNIGTFTANECYGFNKVVQKKSWYDLCRSDNVIWESCENNEHAVKIFIYVLGSHQSTQEVQIYLSNGELLKYIKSGGICSKQWTLVESKQITAAKIGSSESDMHISVDQLHMPSNASIKPKISSRTPVDLNIKKTESTDYLEYVRDELEDLKIYNAKEKFVFSAIKKSKRCFNCANSTKILWEANNESEYVYKVILKGSKDYPRYLLLLPIEGDFILLYKESKDNDWRDITSLRISFSDFSFFGTDKTSSGIKQIYYENMWRSTYKFMFGYRFKEGVRCSEVMYKGVTLWTNFDISKDNYPHGVYYDLVSKKLNILLSDNKFISLEIPDNKIKTIPVSRVEETKDTKPTKPSISSVEVSIEAHVEDKDSKTEDQDRTKETSQFSLGNDSKGLSSLITTPFTPTAKVTSRPEHTMISRTSVSPVDQRIGKFSEQDGPLILKTREDSSLSDGLLEQDFKIITKDPSDNTKTKENDKTQYDVDDYKNMLNYKFKNNAKCVSLKHGKNVIWKSQTISDHPKSIFLFKTAFLFILEMPNNKFRLYGLTSNNIFESESLVSVAVFGETTIKIITKDPLDNNNTKENDSTQYKFIKFDFAFVYIFNEDAECIQVIQGDETIWKYDHNQSSSYPDSIYIFSDSILVFPKR